MASYAPNNTPNQDPTDITLNSAKSPNRYHLARGFRRTQMRELSEVNKTLLDDATPTSSASVQVQRVEAVADTSANVLGGKRIVETVELMGNVLDSQPSDASANTARVVTAADVTTIQKALEGGSDQLRSPSTYPVDKSGNGGGGKLD